MTTWVTQAQLDAEDRCRERADAEELRRERIRELHRVESARQLTTDNDCYWPIPSWEVPQGIKFSTPKHRQGQIVEYSYGTYGRSEAGEGDPYMCRCDRSRLPGDQTTYYKHRKVSC